MVSLIDTPGFNDTSRPDMEILDSLMKFLRGEQLVDGVIYMHNIRDRRMTGSSVMNLNMVRAICGEHFFSHLVLVTSMWDGATKGEAEMREHELISSPELWENMITKGAIAKRFAGDHASGIDILDCITYKPKSLPLGIQIELRDGRGLADTTAGQVITTETRRREERLRKEQQEEMEELEREKAEAAVFKAEAERTKQRLASQSNPDQRRSKDEQSKLAESSSKRMALAGAQALRKHFAPRSSRESRQG